MSIVIALPTTRHFNMMAKQNFLVTVSSMTKLLIWLLLAGQGIDGWAMIVDASITPEKQSNERSEFPQGTFSLSPTPENPKRYDLSISDDNERSVSGSFSTDQLQILRAIMTEAEKFALSAEGLNAKEPVTTRFMDKHEPAFIVDVEKSTNRSLLFLTLKTEIGSLTWEAGRIIHSTRREDGFFFDLLTRLESILPKLSGPSPK
jgi:hypothetical protein